MIGHWNAAVRAGNRLFAVTAGNIGVVSSAVKEQYGLLSPFKIAVDSLDKLGAEHPSRSRHIDYLGTGHLRLSVRVGAVALRHNKQL